MVMQITRLRLKLPFLIAILCIFSSAQSQVNTVEYGKNRIQYKKFSWKFYQSQNFNTYFNNGGLELAKYITQVAEEELRSIENTVEYSLQRRANLIIYNNYDDFKSSNIGLGIDWQNSGGLTKLVNNKVPLYFDGNHNTLRLKIREGIARILTDNILFGDDIGEFASNQALLDLPEWLTDGYVSYVSEPWSTEKDDALKSAMLGGNYTKFYQFAFKEPLLAGHAFWYYIARKYKPENVTYFLYLARLYKNLNTASERITKKKFKDLLEEFMVEEQDRYFKDLKQRRNAPRGKLSVVEEITKSDFYHFAANPNPKNNSYAVVKFTKGKYSVQYINNLYETKTLLEYGIKTHNGKINPNYPILAWDGKGSRLLVVYSSEGKSYMFVYDVIANVKRFKQEIEGFDQILDAGFIFDANTLLLSAAKNGHTDLFTYRIDNFKVKQITNDVYDDIDPTFVSFRDRLGIIFASNRPGVNAPNADTAIPSRNRFNIFLADINNNSEFRQITKLTNMKYGDARFPMQYNQNHFTFVSDENGINNRWAGFFTSQTGGLDTLLYIGEDVLHNPTDKDLDSTLQAWQKQQPDSVSYFKTYEDSTYTFPITNYQSSLLETRVAGNNDQVSEVRREGDLKFLYKLKVDSLALVRRNINARPTDYIKQKIQRDRLAAGSVIDNQNVNTSDDKEGIFQSEFEDERKQDSSGVDQRPSDRPLEIRPNALSRANLYNYRLKFDADYILAGFTNNILVNRYQPYTGGTGPVVLNSGNDLNLTLRLGISDVFEDIKIIGGFRLGTTLTDKDVFVTMQNYRKRIDWGVTYYRSNTSNYFGFFKGPLIRYDNVVYTNLYQFNLAYPFSEVNSFRATVGLRVDRGVVKPFDFTGYPDPGALGVEDSSSSTLLTRFEFVHDNTIHPTENIYDGLRWKIYADLYLPVSQSSFKGTQIYNLGFDARYYKPIYRNFIWALRAAGDMSFGETKLIYYLGGVDGWFDPKFNSANQPSPNENYAFQTLAVNMRGYQQNVANGNNAVVINSEFRLPVFTTFFNKPINNAFLRNFQLVQFADLGTAWAGDLKNIKRPTNIFGPESPDNPIIIRQRAGGIGPLAGGYGFGVRSTLLGYFMKLDAAWPMNVFFNGKPVYYFALGFDF